MKGFLFLLLYFILAFPLAAQDEWDIFDDPPEESMEEDWDIFTEPKPPALSFEGFNTLNISGNLEFFRETLIDPDNTLTGIKPISYTYLHHWMAQVDFFSRCFLFIESALSLSNKELGGIEEAYPHPAEAYFALDKLSLEYRFSNYFQIELGIQPVILGNNLLFNPVNFLSRYVVDPSRPGAYSFPSIKVSAIKGTNIFSLLYIPYSEPVQNFINRKGSSLFQTGYEGNMLILTTNHFLWNNNFSLFGFCDFLESDDIRLGGGTEWQLTPADFLNLSFQGLFSNGRPWYELTALGEVHLLEEKTDSEDDFFLEICVDTDVTIMNLITLKLGYLYNQRGLNPKELSRWVDGLQKEEEMFHSYALDAATGLAYTPQIFMEHQWFLGFMVPEVIENLNANLFFFAGVQDLSFQVLSNISYEFNPDLSFQLQSLHNVGTEETLYGLSSTVTSLSLGIELFL